MADCNNSATNNATAELFHAEEEEEEDDSGEIEQGIITSENTDSLQ